MQSLTRAVPIVQWSYLLAPLTLLFATTACAESTDDVAAAAASGAAGSTERAAADPGQALVLQQRGSGHLTDLVSGEPAFVPFDRRIHVVLVAEGYQAHDLPQFQADVDEWIDEVFAIEPFDALREAFVIWSLPRASATHIDDNATAFAVPTQGGRGVGSELDETGRRLWDVLDALPVPIVQARLAGERHRTARNVVAAFLIFDPRTGRAGISGRAVTLADARGKRRVHAALGRHHAHEFTHAVARLRDEYMAHGRRTRSAPETSNVVPSRRCSVLPWQHLLSDGAYNPGVEGLVGAFGREPMGFHPELRCLMNGSHDNAEFYGGDGRLRDYRRLCNFCREMAAFRIHERAQLIGTFEAWKTHYRRAFYARFGFEVPGPLPQRNSAGAAVFEPCTP